MHTKNSGTNTQGTVSSLSTTDPMYIGASHQRFNDGWDGLIDEVMIFNRSLSPEQVSKIYQASLNGNALKNFVSNETIKNQNWTVVVTPTDSYNDGSPVTSNILTIENKPPSAKL